MKWFLIFALCLPAFGTTYYVSSVSGDDTRTAATAQSKSTPWAHAPGMANASSNAAAFNPAAGDSIIFKGGESWTNASFPFVIKTSGSSGNVIYYGVDQTWFTGGSWTRPTFDMGGTATGGNNHIIDGQTNSVSWVTIDNIEMIGFFWAEAPAFGHDIQIYMQDATNTIMDHLYVHSWSHGTGAGCCNNWDFMEVYFSGIGGSSEQTNIFRNSVISCAVGDGPCQGDSGQCWRQGAIVYNNVCHDIPNGLVGENYQFHDNLVYNINASFDPLTHLNAYEGWANASGATQYIYNNVVHDTNSGAFMYDIDPMFGTGNGGHASLYFFNNVGYNVGSSNGPIIADTNCSGATTCNPAASSAFIWNNTLYAQGGTGQCLLIEGTGRGPSDYGTLDYRNNHCITTQSPAWTLATGANAPSPSTPNILMTPTTATSQGYTSSETYAFSPTLNTNSTVGAGTQLCGGVVVNCTGNLASLANDTTYGCNVGAGNVSHCPARPSNLRAATPDAGAYQFSGGPASAPWIFTKLISPKDKSWQHLQQYFHQ